MSSLNPQPAVPSEITRLRLSLFDFNPSFVKADGLIFTGKVATGCVLNTELLDAFQAARIDDYSLVRTITFNGEDADHNAQDPAWAKNFNPRNQPPNENLRVDYLKKLTQEMHRRGAQVIAGYELVERGKIVTDEGSIFRNWLKAASNTQVTKHARNIVYFFDRREIPVDGIGFDIELNGLDSDHAANLAVLFNETAKAFAIFRKGAFVYYDNAPFRPNDGEGSSLNMKILGYNLAKDTDNLIARPMCYNKHVTSEGNIEASINCALREMDTGGGGLTPRKVQYAIDVARTDNNQVKSYCTNLFRAKLVGMTIYTMPPGKHLAFLKEKVPGWEAALNPGTPPPGTIGEPYQMPLLEALG